MVLRATHGAWGGGSQEGWCVIHVKGDASGLRDSRGGSVSSLESGREPGTFGGWRVGRFASLFPAPVSATFMSP